MKNFIYILFLILGMNAYSQNLVPNPSFEEYIICPNITFEDIGSANSWYNPTSYSPDYYNQCATEDPINGNSVPQNYFGFQEARTGVAYAGLLPQVYDEGREYIQAKLIDTMIFGKRYVVSFFVALADSAYYTVSEIGAYFSNTPISSTDSHVLPYSPQIQNNSALNPLIYPNVWMEVRDTMIALGNESYITIGNFMSDSNTDTIHLNNSDWLNYSYFYIDDVSVTCLDCEATVKPAYQNSFNIFPNPFRDVINIKSPCIESIELINNVGKSVLLENDLNGNTAINTSILPSGIYILKIISCNFSISKIVYKF